MVLDETMNDPNTRFEAAAILPQLALQPVGDYPRSSGWQGEDLSPDLWPVCLSDDEDSEDEEDMDDDENFDDMDDDFDDEDDDFDDEDDDYEDEDDEDYDYEEDVDYDDFDE